MYLWYFLVTFLSFFLHFHLCLTLFCPNSCNCKNGGKYVNCKNKSLQKIPQDIPRIVEQLDLSKNILNNISSKIFLKYGNLRLLKMNNCEIKSIAKDAFEGLNYLRKLYLTNNDIEMLHEDTFKNMKRLLNVYLTNNEFQSVPPLISFSITRINLDGNHITSARIHSSLKSNTALRTLVLTNNKITSLNKSDFINLRNTGVQSLMLKMNNIDFIHPLTFEPVKDSLQVLELEGNQLLTSVQLEEAIRAFSGGSRLTFLDLRNTGLTNISRLFFQPLIGSKLHRLDIGNNPQLSFIDDDAFHELNSVQEFLADKCKLASSNVKFSAMSGLRQMYLSHNNLMECPRHFPGSVERVDLSHNDIRRIIKDDFKSLTSLKVLNLANNAIRSIERHSFSDLSLLESLDLSFNRLATVDSQVFASSMSALANLYLQQQSPCLKTISADSFVLRNLQKMDLGRNCLDGPTMGTPIFRKCPRLWEISLVSNSIEYLTDSFFDGCRNLSVLNLSHNEIQRWSPKTFTHITSTLTDLDLSFNNLGSLSTIESQDNYLPMYFQTLKNISLSNNHWNCTCTSIQWIIAYKLFLKDLDKVICEYPNDKSGRKLFDLAEMKQCKIDIVVPGHHPQSQVSKSRAGQIILYIFLVLLLSGIIFGLFIFRKTLRRYLRRIGRKNPYQLMPSSSSSMVQGPEPRMFVNPILDEEIPELGYNQLVINETNMSLSSTSDMLDLSLGHDFDSLSSSMEDTFDIVFLSKESHINTGNISTKVLDNLQSLDHKRLATLCHILVVDYSMIEEDKLKGVLEARRRDRSGSSNKRRRTYLFYNEYINDQEREALALLFGPDNMVECATCDLCEGFYRLFDDDQ